MKIRRVLNQLNEGDPGPAFYPLPKAESLDSLVAPQEFADPIPKPARSYAMNDLDLFGSVEKGPVDEPIDQGKGIFNRQTNDVKRRGGFLRDSLCRPCRLRSLSLLFPPHGHSPSRCRRERPSPFPSPS